MAKETTFDDEYAGRGGNYVVDPKTGKRTLVSRTEDSAPSTDQSVASPSSMNDVSADSSAGDMTTTA